MARVKLTGLWKSTDKDGRRFLSGSVGMSRLMIFENGYKDKEKDPDYIAYLVASDKQTVKEPGDLNEKHP